MDLVDLNACMLYTYQASGGPATINWKDCTSGNVLFTSFTGQIQKCSLNEPFISSGTATLVGTPTGC